MNKIGDIPEKKRNEVKVEFNNLNISPKLKKLLKYCKRNNIRIKKIYSINYTNKVLSKTLSAYGRHVRKAIFRPSIFTFLSKKGGK